MTWVQIDDGMAEHPKIVGLTDRAFRVHVRGLCWAMRHLTDGRIPEALGREWGIRYVRELVNAVLWKPLEDGWEIHDFLKYNPSREQVEKRRADSRARMDKSRRRSHEHNAQQKANQMSPLPQTPVPPVDGSGIQISSKARSKSADAPVENRGKPPTSTQEYLLEKLHKRSEVWGPVTFGAIVKLGRQYSQPIVTTALQRAVDEEDPPRGSAYGLLEAMCKDVEKLQQSVPSPGGDR